jgi:hypothetical protein
MARRSEEFLMAWSSLSVDTSKTGWQSISVTPAGAIEVSAGLRAPDAAEAILIRFPRGRSALSKHWPEGQGFVVELVSSEDNESLWLALTRKVAGNVDLFLDMACDVSNALDEAVAAGVPEERLLQVFIARVRAWQEFMRKGSQTLSTEAEIGLVGELSALMEMVGAGISPDVVVTGWLGPLDGIQDFELGTGALEVKTTLSATGFPAHIRSLQQLDNSVRQPLFVVGKRLKQGDVGLTLPDYVQKTRQVVVDDLIAAAVLDNKLIAAGYRDAHAAHYSRRFTVVDTLILEVDDDFPCLTIGRVPSGVMNAMYDINLEQATGSRVDMAIALKQMGAA